MAQDWVRLDNASNIFLAARTDVDTKVFRLVAEVDHEVDRTLLQRALDVTFDRYPLLTRGAAAWTVLVLPAGQRPGAPGSRATCSTRVPRSIVPTTVPCCSG
jgi:hypothetical protein